MKEEDVGYLVEILATSSGKWREIGIQLGFTPNELDSLPFSPKPVNCLTYMLNEWTQWVIGGNHNKCANMEDLERALRSGTVNLEDVADELRAKLMQDKGQFLCIMCYCFIFVSLLCLIWYSNMVFLKLSECVILSM